MLALIPAAWILPVLLTAVGALLLWIGAPASSLMFTRDGRIIARQWGMWLLLTGLLLVALVTILKLWGLVFPSMAPDPAPFVFK